MSIVGHSVDAAAPKRGLPSMIFMAVAAGVIAGLGAWAFRMLIGLVHNVLFLGQFTFAYDANVHTPPSPLGVAVALVPVIGAVAVAPLFRSVKRSAQRSARSSRCQPRTG